MARTKSAETAAKELAEVKEFAKNVENLSTFPELMADMENMKSALAKIVNDVFETFSQDNPNHAEAVRFIVWTLKNAEAKTTGLFNDHVKDGQNKKLIRVKRIGGETGAPKKVVTLTPEQIKQNKLIEMGLKSAPVAETPES